MMKDSRRDFLKKSGCALGMTALATQMGHFGLMSALAQKADESVDSGTTTGYKALVLLYMAGGNDGNNTVIPNHNDSTIANYTVYSNARSQQGLAIPQAQLLPISVPRMGGLIYGLNPNLGPLATGGINNGMHELWAQGKMAIVANCGTLVRPLTKSQYQSPTFQKPYQLFSHSDQVEQSQTTISTTQAFTGWGGRLADRMTSTSNPNGLVPMVTSISGAQLFTAGQTTLPLAINNANTPLANVLAPAGFTNTGGPARRVSWDELRGYDRNSNYIAAASNVTSLAMQANTALGSTSQEVTVPFPSTSVGLQLKQVARLIQKRNQLQIGRQVFYVQIGSFDTHTNQLTGQTSLLAQMSQAVRAFYDEMVTQGVQNDVTLFTLSDFGRTFVPAGTGSSVGSDHAWGNHMFVIGGSVLGGDFYGLNGPNGTPFPTLAIGTTSPDDTDNGSGARGRWIPSTSVDQYAAVLAKWYGLDAADQSIVFPNIGAFPATDQLNFMSTP